MRVVRSFVIHNPLPDITQIASLAAALSGGGNINFQDGFLQYSGSDQSIILGVIFTTIYSNLNFDAEI